MLIAWFVNHVCLFQLRQLLTGRGNGAADNFANFEEENEDNGYHGENADFGEPDFDVPENMPMDKYLPFQNEKVSI